MRILNQDEFEAIHASHRQWIDHPSTEYRANLTEADLIGLDLTGANLSRAILSKADLSKTNLTGADLTGADLIGANLTGANLIRADLSVADLTLANLKGADLSGADLSGANLSGADLSGADLSEADLSEANLASAALPTIEQDFLTKVRSTVHKGTAFKLALKEGRVDGYSYNNTCKCLVGWLNEEEDSVIKEDPSSPIERFLLAIKPSDTPETNQVSAIVLSWFDKL